MRTTLDIDEDVLEAARDMARRRRQSIGKVISEVFRANVRAQDEWPVRNGVYIIPRGSGAKRIVTLEDVNKLRDELP